jgi:hypothetical protein
MKTGMNRIIVCAVLVVSAAFAQDWGAAAPLLAAPQGQPPFVPRPFPGSAPAKPGDPASPPAAPPATPVETTPPVAVNVPPNGLPVYPTAEFIEVFDAGHGQQYYLYGVNAPYAEIITYYKNTLKTGGRELYKTPPMQQFDLGRFQDESMSYPPSVVVKDYTWNGSQGYLAVSGTSEKRFKTIIQIVPPTATR